MTYCGSFAESIPHSKYYVSLSKTLEEPGIGLGTLVLYFRWTVSFDPLRLAGRMTLHFWLFLGAALLLSLRTAGPHELCSPRIGSLFAIDCSGLQIEHQRLHISMPGLDFEIVDWTEALAGVASSVGALLVLRTAP